jgi:hypothetical protein
MLPGKRHTIKHLGFQPFRLLTEMLEVRILPGEPNLFELKQLQSAGRTFGYGPNAWACEMKSGVRMLVTQGHFLQTNQCQQPLS